MTEGSRVEAYFAEKSRNFIDRPVTYALTAIIFTVFAVVYQKAMTDLKSF